MLRACSSMLDIVSLTQNYFWILKNLEILRGMCSEPRRGRVVVPRERFGQVGGGICVPHPEKPSQNSRHLLEPGQGPGGPHPRASIPPIKILGPRAASQGNRGRLLRRRSQDPIARHQQQLQWPTRKPARAVMSSRLQASQFRFDMKARVVVDATCCSHHEASRDTVSQKVLCFRFRRTQPNQRRSSPATSASKRHAFEAGKQP